MKTNKKILELKTSITIKGNIKEAKCDVEIYKVGDEEKLIIMMPPKESEKYEGASTTNLYEEFATAVKKKYLSDISTKNITWIDRLVFTNSEDYPTFNKEVTMNFDGKIFSNPIWGKVLSDC